MKILKDYRQFLNLWGFSFSGLFAVVFYSINVYLDALVFFTLYSLPACQVDRWFRRVALDRGHEIWEYFQC